MNRVYRYSDREGLGKLQSNNSRLNCVLNVWERVGNDPDTACLISGEMTLLPRDKDRTPTEKISSIFTPLTLNRRTVEIR